MRASFCGKEGDELMKTVTLTHYFPIFHVWASFSLRYQEIVPLSRLWSLNSVVPSNNFKSWVMVRFVDCLKNTMNIYIFGVFMNGMKFYDDMLLNLQCCMMGMSFTFHFILVFLIPFWLL